MGNFLETLGRSGFDPVGSVRAGLGIRAALDQKKLQDKEAQEAAEQERKDNELVNINNMDLLPAQIDMVKQGFEGKISPEGQISRKDFKLGLGELVERGESLQKFIAPTIELAKNKADAAEKLVLEAEAKLTVPDEQLAKMRKNRDFLKQDFKRVSGIAFTAKTKAEEKEFGETIAERQEVGQGLQEIQSQLQQVASGANENNIPFSPEIQEAGVALLRNPSFVAAMNSGTAEGFEIARSMMSEAFPAVAEEAGKDKFQARKDTEEFSRIVFKKGFTELSQQEARIASDLAQNQRLDLALAKTAGQSAVRQKAKLSAAKATLDALSESANKVFTQSGVLSRLAAVPANAVGVFFQTDKDAVLYQSLKGGVLAMFVRAFGDVGTLNEGDINRASKLTPTLFPIPDTKEVAQGKLAQLKKLFKEIASRDPGTGTLQANAQFVGFSRNGNPVLVMPDGKRVEITP